MRSSVIANELPKASPDFSKLIGMTSRVVQVTKYTSKNGAGQMVLSAVKGKSTDEIMDLHRLLPKTWGPGTYKFEVFDEGGPEKDVWTVRLGNENEGMTMPEGTAATPFSSPPTSSESVNIGHGYWYTESLGILTTPKGIFRWSRGEPLPVELMGTSGGSTSIGHSSMPGLPGWGSYPVLPESKDNREVELLRDQLKMLTEQRREQEFSKQMSEMREGFSESLKTIVSKLENKGPSAEMQALQSRLDAAERASQDARREAEDRRREDQLRAEMKAAQDRTDALLKELSGSKTDPMVTMLSNVMAASQSTNAETIKAIRDSSVAQATSAERAATTVSQQLGGSVMTPMQIIDMLRFAKDSSANNEVNKGMIDMFQSLFGMAKGLVKDQAEMYGQGQGPAWMPIVQTLADKVGTVAQAIAASKEHAKAELEAKTMQAHQQNLERERARRQRKVVTVPVAPALPQSEEAPQQQQARPLTSAEARAQMAKQVYGTPAPTPKPAVVAVAVPIAEESEEPSVETPEASANVPPINQVPASEVRKLVEGMTDEEIFEEMLLPHIEQLRESVVKGMAPPEIVNAVMEARKFLAYAGQFPPCLELLDNGHVEILVDRLLPGSLVTLRQQVVEGLKTALKG